jgi:hypothetical protein
MTRKSDRALHFNGLLETGNGLVTVFGLLILIPGRLVISFAVTREPKRVNRTSTKSATPCRKAWERSPEGSTEGTSGDIMSYHNLFWALCAVIAANIVVATIAIVRAYRDERRQTF